MSLSRLSASLQELLIKNKRVVLPEVGTFMIEDIPSVFLLGGKTLTPPAKKIHFTAADAENDGELEASYALLNGISPDAGKNALAMLLAEIKRSLEEHSEITLPGFGSINPAEGGELYFSADKDFNVCPDSYPLEPISLKTESRRGMIREIRQEEVPQEQTPEITVPAGESIAGESIEIEMEPETFIAAEVIVPEKEKNGVETEELPPITQEPFPAEEPDYRPEFPAQEEPAPQQYPSGPGEIQAEATPDSHATILPPPPVEEPARQEPTIHPVPGKADKTHKWLWIMLIILGSILIVLLLIYLFRDELQPVLEKLLYSKEELEILIQAGKNL